MNAESKVPNTRNLGPVAEELHRKIKVAAVAQGKSIRDVLEETLGPIFGWQPEDKAQLKLAGVAS